LSAEDRRDVLDILNAGYKTGATVPRCGSKEVNYDIRDYAVYSPIGFGCIRGLNDTTEDRAIPVVMQRAISRRKLNVEVNLRADYFRGVRRDCYRALLMRWAEVDKAYRTVTLPEWLNGRARELWKPLIAVAYAAEQDSSDGVALTFTQDLLALAKEHVGDRPG